jgi:endonuclease/exonuclease/phosphatase family metal-dependent hydrolase
MPEGDIGGGPPEHVLEDIRALSQSLDLSPIPPKSLDRNLLIGTWNIRHFGGITEKWTTESTDSPKRNLRDVLCLAEIVSRFDVVALQEVKRELRGLRLLMQALGPNWAFILTDVTKGREGNQERMAFLFDLRRARPSGLAAELVVAIEEETTATEDTMRKQFARTPYAVSFESQGATCTLVTLHVLYGKDPGERLPEIKGIARWLAEWAREGDEFGDNLIALGDFNIDREGDPLYEAFVATGLRPAPEHAQLPRTIYDKPEAHHHYDQIAWFTGETGSPGLKPPIRYESRGGNFDFRPVLQGSLSNVTLSWRISDHFPLWASFSIRRSL